MFLECLRGGVLHVVGFVALRLGGENWPKASHREKPEGAREPEGRARSRRGVHVESHEKWSPKPGGTLVLKEETEKGESERKVGNGDRGERHKKGEVFQALGAATVSMTVSRWRRVHRRRRSEAPRGHWGDSSGAGWG